MSDARLNAARQFSGQKSPYGDTTAAVRGTFAQFPMTYPKYSLDNSVNGALETGLRLYLPVSNLLKSNPRDADILKPLVNNKYIQLIATNVAESFNERTEVNELINGKFATYYFGTKPPTLAITGRVLNDAIDDWRNQLLRLYTKYISGTNLSKMGRFVLVSYSDLIISGECTSLSTDLAGNSETHGGFSLNLIVHRMSIKRSAVVSDFVTREQNRLTSAPQPSQVSSKKPTTVIRGSGSSDVLTQKALTKEEFQKRLDALETQKTIARSDVTTAQSDLDARRNALNRYIQNNPNDNLTTIEGRDLRSKVRAAETDLRLAQRRLATIEEQQKRLKDNTLGRDPSLERRRKATSSAPDRVITVGGRKKPTSTSPIIAGGA